jgi:hypothetical protein
MKKLLLGLKEESFSPDNNLDVAWVMQHEGGEKSVELQGMAFLNFYLNRRLKMRGFLKWGVTL